MLSSSMQPSAMSKYTIGLRGNLAWGLFPEMALRMLRTMLWSVLAVVPKRWEWGRQAIDFHVFFVLFPHC